MDLKSKGRSGRGIIATAAIGAGVTLAEKLLGKAVDYLFDSRSRKTEHSVSELKASLHTINNKLHLSSIELCTLGRQFLEEKINRIVLELSFSMENQIRNEIQNLYFGNLDSNYKLSACLELNEHASKYDCLNIIRKSEFAFNILAIEHENDLANIQLQILTPILSKTIIGHRLFNLGVPLVQDDKFMLIKGSIPNFISVKDEYIFKTEPEYNVIEENLIILNPPVDYDCFKNYTDGDKICDATTEITSSSFIIKHIQGHTILINFIQCSFTSLNKIEEPIFFAIGTHIVKVDLGFLTCGQERISFGHKSIQFRKHVSLNTYEIKFNYKEVDMFKNIHHQNILDDDHILEQISVFPYISLRFIIITVIAFLILTALIACFCFYKRTKALFRRHAPPALVY